MSSTLPINNSKGSQYLYIPNNENISKEPIKGLHRNYHSPEDSHFPVKFDSTKDQFIVNVANLKDEHHNKGSISFMAALSSTGQEKQTILNLASLQIGHDDRPKNLRAQGNAPTSQSNNRYYSNTLEKFEAVIKDNPRTDFEEACMKRYAKVYSAYTTMFKDCCQKITKEFPKTVEKQELSTGVPNSFAEFYPPQKSDTKPDFKIVVIPSKALAEESKEMAGLDDDEAHDISGEFPVHKMVVMQQRVPVLKTALMSKMKDSLDSGVYTFRGTTQKAVEQFISFLYTNSVTVQNDQEGVELYKLADQYHFEDLKKVTQNYAARAALLLANPEKNDELLHPETFSKHLADAKTIAEIENLFNTQINRIKQSYENFLSPITKDLYTK
jgi:hypothetical protein